MEKRNVTFSEIESYNLMDDVNVYVDGEWVAPLWRENWGEEPYMWFLPLDHWDVIQSFDCGHEDLEELQDMIVQALENASDEKMVNVMEIAHLLGG